MRRARHSTLWTLAVAVAAAGLAGSALIAVAADFPTREIELVVSFPPGGPADTGARIVAPKLAEVLGKSVVVVNKTGGGGAVGADYAAKARPDGHTLYFSTNSVLTVSPHLVKDLPYKRSDFAPLGAVAVDLGVITMKAGGPARTLEEFVEYARKNPGKLNYGSAGFGTVSFFTMELFKLAFGLDLVHVPFRGTGPVKTAILGGQVNLATSGFGSLAPVIRSGDLIALVTTAPRRVAAFPDVPTMAEKGHPEAVINIWMGVYAPAQTPRDVQELLVKAVARVARDPSVVGAIEKAGMNVDYHDPAETLKNLEAESARVGQVVDKLGIGKPSK